MYKFIKFLMILFIVVFFTLPCCKKEVQPSPVREEEQPPPKVADYVEIDPNGIDPNQVFFYDKMPPVEEPVGTTRPMP